MGVFWHELKIFLKRPIIWVLPVVLALIMLIPSFTTPATTMMRGKSDSDVLLHYTKMYDYFSEQFVSEEKAGDAAATQKIAAYKKVKAAAESGDRLDYQKQVLALVKLTGPKSNEIPYLQYLVDNNIPRFYSVDNHITAVDRLIHYGLGSENISLEVFLILALVVAFSLANPKKKRTDDYLYSLPKSKTTIFLAEILVVAVGLSFVFLAAVVLNLIIPTFTEGFGTLRQVLWEGGTHTAQHYAWALILEKVAYVFAFVFFFATIGVILKQFIAKGIVVAVPLFLIVLLSKTPQLSTDSSVLMWLPSQYISTSLIHYGDALVWGSLTGVFVLLLYSGVLIILFLLAQLLRAKKIAWQK